MHACTEEAAHQSLALSRDGEAVRVASAPALKGMVEWVAEKLR